MIKKQIRDNLLKLKPLEKIEAIELLSESLDKPDPELERIMAKESDRRYKEYKAGKIKAKDLSTVLKALK